MDLSSIEDDRFSPRGAVTPTRRYELDSLRLGSQQAAIVAGFQRKIAAQLTAALGEFHSNVYEHSDASGTGIVAFHTRPGRFEFVVSDRGIGVLRSLRSGPDYPNLTDHGEALRLTLTDRVSPLRRQFR